MSFFQDLSLSGIQILTPLVLLFFSAFFSFAEAAIFAISSTELASKKNSAANILKKMVFFSVFFRSLGFLSALLIFIIIKLLRQCDEQKILFR